jgi:predicted nucleotidyltransferase
MELNEVDKSRIKNNIVDVLKDLASVERVIVFGSFSRSTSPHDIDIAVIEDSDEDYLTLAMEYRRRTREISKMIPLDIFPIPVKNLQKKSSLIAEIIQGETIYERRI